MRYIRGQWTCRRHIVRDWSVNAASAFPDAYFDWVYIDALHTKQGSLNDMRAWWPKLRPGGLFSGDDFADTEDVPEWHYSRESLSKHLRWVAEVNDQGVVRALRDFVNEIGYNGSVQVTYSDPVFPTWYFVKPE